MRAVVAAGGRRWDDAAPGRTSPRGRDAEDPAAECTGGWDRWHPVPAAHAAVAPQEPPATRLDEPPVETFR